MAESKVVLITGCSQGIGQATALHLARDPQRQFKVYATMRNLAAARENDLKTKAGSTFDDTLFIRELDVTKQETIDKTVTDIIDKEGAIDVLINNAAIVSSTWWASPSMDAFYDVMDVNFFGCVRTTKAVVPHMKAKRSGKILQISSVVGFKAVPAITQYISAKFALEGFTESIAPPLRKYNVWASILNLGIVASPMAQDFGDTAAQQWTTHADQIPNEEERQIVLQMLTSRPEIVVGTEIQTTEEITKLFQDVILNPEPDFRISTSKTVKGMACKRFKDPTGNSIIASWLE